LTDQGRQYLDAVSSALLQIERASEQLVGHEEARLRLSVFSSFAVRWLVPRLPYLQRLHPQLDLALEMSSGNPVLSDRVADCFITIRTDAAAFSYDKLYEERLFPVCSQDYWKRMRRELGRDDQPEQRDAPPLSPEELARFPLLSTHSIFDRAGGDWQAWCAAVGEERGKGEGVGWGERGKGEERGGRGRALGEERGGRALRVGAAAAAAATGDGAPHAAGA